MTTPTLDLLQRHGSVRKYTTDPVPRELIDLIQPPSGQRRRRDGRSEAQAPIRDLRARPRSPGARRAGVVRGSQTPRPRLRAPQLQAGDRLCREFPDVRPRRRHRCAERRCCRGSARSRHLLPREYPEQHSGGDRTALASPAGVSGRRHGCGLACLPSGTKGAPSDLGRPLLGAVRRGERRGTP